MGLWKPSVFLLPKLSKRGLRLARRSSFGVIHCFCTEKDGRQSAYNDAWTKIRALPLVQAPNQNTYLLARKTADAIVARLSALIPGFFQCDALDLQALFRFHLQFFLAYTGLPFLLSAAQTLDSAQKCTVIDSHFSPELLQDFLAEICPEAGLKTFRCKTTITAKNIQRKLQQWQDEAQPLPAEAHAGGAWGLVHHAEHFKFIEPVLDVFSKSKELHYLLTQPHVKNQTGYAAYPLPSLYQGPRLLQCAAFVEALLRKIQKLPSRADRAFCLSQMDLLVELCRKLLVFESALRQFKPQVLVGCLEYNSYGPLASLLKDEYSYRLINVQHGLIAPSWAFDGLNFDDYLVWNEKSAEVVRQDGYALPETLRVVGNPMWETLAHTIQSAMPSKAYPDLLAWKGNSPLIGAYPQSLQGYSTATVKKQYIQALLDYLRRNPEPKLLIKKHPLDSDSLAEDLVSQSGLGDRVRIYASDQLALWESLKVADVVTSVFSATLLEALYLRKPTVAIDLENTIAQQALPIEDVLPVVTHFEGISPVLDQLLHSQPSRNAKSALSALVPHFENPYRQRVQTQLHV